METLDRIRSDLEELNISLTDRQEQQFISYYQLLIEWNQKMNLTAITEYEEVLTRHFLDSLTITRVIDPQKLFSGNLSIADVGTGAGFPGIPLKIAFPECKIVLIDSLNKRVRFLQAVMGELGLSAITAVHGRSEELARKPEYREQFDLVVSRAVANLSTLSEYCIPFVKQGGCFISYKSRSASQEIQDAKRAIRLLGGKLEEEDHFSLAGTDQERCLIRIVKVSPTPKKYPRKAGTPAKEPL